MKNNFLQNGFDLLAVQVSFNVQVILCMFFTFLISMVCMMTYLEKKEVKN